MAIIDTLKIYESLKAQMPERSAKAVAVVLEQSFEEYRVNQGEFLATKRDLAEFQAATKVDFADLRSEINQDMTTLRSEITQDMATLRSEIKQNMATLRVEIKQDMATLQADTDIKFAKLRTEIAGVRSELIKWMFIFWVGQIGVLGTFLLALR